MNKLGGLIAIQQLTLIFMTSLLHVWPGDVHAHLMALLQVYCVITGNYNVKLY